MIPNGASLPAAALFATGWPFEGDCGANAPACWRQRDALFWEGIEAAWRAGRCRGSNDGGSGGSGNGRASGCSSSRALPRPRLRRPLCTDFSHGAGPAFYQAGRCLSPKPWYNMSLQALQPLLHVRHFASNGSNGSGDGSDGGSPAVQASVADERAFSGGSSLRVSGHLAAAQRVAVQLFEPAACLPAGCVWVRLTASVTGSVLIRLLLQLDGSSEAAAAPEGSSSEQAAAGATIELRPLLPSDAAAAEASAGAAVQPVSESAGASALVVTAEPCACTPCAAAADGGDAAAPAAWHTWQFCLQPDAMAEAGHAAVLAGVALLLLSSDSGTGSSGSSDCGSSAGAFEVHLGALGWQPGAELFWLPQRAEPMCLSTATVF